MIPANAVGKDMPTAASHSGEVGPGMDAADTGGEQLAVIVGEHHGQTAAGNDRAQQVIEPGGGVIDAGEGIIDDAAQQEEQQRQEKQTQEEKNKQTRNREKQKRR